MKNLLYCIAVASCLVACEKNIQGNSTSNDDFVDLELTSGTKWKSANETNPNNVNGFYLYDEARTIFGNDLPTKEQWMELMNECEWTWTDAGYRVIGKNGQSIVLPAAGDISCDGQLYDDGKCGLYWSSTPNGSDNAWNLFFISGGVHIFSYLRCCSLSVRLVR